MKKYGTNSMVFRIAPQMLAEVADIAEDNMISASAVCRQAVSHYIKKMKADTGIDLPQNNVVNV